VQENPILKGFPIFDLDQIEVLRGPQGTLFGRNTPGGVVKFNSVRPSTDLEGYASLSDATYNTLNFEGGINLPLGSGWSARLSGLYQHRDDFVSNTLTDQKDIYEGYDDRAARLQVRYDGGDDFNALISAHFRSLDGTARLFRANIIQSGTNDLVAGFDQDDITVDGHNKQELNNSGGSVQFKWNFGAVALYSITGYESLDAYSRGDIDGGWGCGFCGLPNGPGFIPFPSETADAVPSLSQFTQEVRLESQSTGALKWQAGVYYFDEDYDIESFSYDSLAGGVQNQYLRSNQTNKAWAVFGSVNYAVTPAFELRAGVRYTNDEKDFVTGTPEGYTFPDPSLPTTAHLDDDNRELGSERHVFDQRFGQRVRAHRHRFPRRQRAARLGVRQPVRGRSGNQYLVRSGHQGRLDGSRRQHLLQPVPLRGEGPAAHRGGRCQQRRAPAERQQDRGPGRRARRAGLPEQQPADDAGRELQ
jgi:iron complex outermembrane receptor protein